MMKIKKYIQFITESSINEVHKLWKMDSDDITDFLVELIDNQYIVNITFGFVENDKYYSYQTKKYEEKEIFTEKVLSGDSIRPAYWIQIIKTNKITNEDVTDSLRFAIDNISDIANAECSIHDSEGNLGDIDGIKIKGGFFYTDNWNSEPELLEANGDYIVIFAKQKDTVKITESQLADYYGWKVEVEKDGKMYAEMDLEDMADYILSKRSEYKDSLIKGIEYMWDYYDIQYYEPEIDSLFSYTLEEETKRLLAKALIKEWGDFEELKTKITGAFETEEEFVEFLVKERFNTSFKKLIKSEFEDSEILKCITEIVANWEMSAHCDDNYEEIVDEFDDIVRDEIGEFVKVVKEVPKYYNIQDAEGNDVRREYKKEVTYFQLPYDNKWIEDVDPEHLHNVTLNSIFKDWIRDQNFNREMNPRISDYGSVDDKKMNEDIRGFLKKYRFKTKTDPNQLKIW